MHSLIPSLLSARFLIQCNKHTSEPGSPRNSSKSKYTQIKLNIKPLPKALQSIESSTITFHEHFPQALKSLAKLPQNNLIFTSSCETFNITSTGSLNPFPVITMLFLAKSLKINQASPQSQILKQHVDLLLSSSISFPHLYKGEKKKTYISILRSYSIFESLPQSISIHLLEILQVALIINIDELRSS